MVGSRIYLSPQVLLGNTHTKSFDLGIYIVFYFATLMFLIKRKKISHSQRCFYIIYSSVLFAISTIAYIGLAFVGQSLWILNRNYPGGPPAYYTAIQSTRFSVVTDVSQTAINVLADALIVRIALCIANMR
jgi:hypothetical protein